MLTMLITVMCFMMLFMLLPVMSFLSVLTGSANVCYHYLGCFPADPPFSGTVERPYILSPWSPHDIQTRFLLYTRNNPNTFQEVSATDQQSILASNFMDSRKTRFVIHGFIAKGEGTWVAKMCQTILKVEDVNCISVDWGKGSMTIYSQAASNVRVVGAEVAYFLKVLQDIYHYDMSKVHIIGHSLGAHVSGEAGKRQSGVGRITGLDPAEQLFQDTPPEVRLDPTDAKLVDVIHTDSASMVGSLGLKGLGMKQTVGHMDFFPNGGEQMPGCGKARFLEKIKNALSFSFSDMTEDLVACNHIRSHKYYMESILTPGGFIGYPTTSYEDFEAGGGFPCPTGECPLMGHYADRYSGNVSKSQTFYLNTGHAKPFARWRYRVTADTAKIGSHSLGSFDISLQGSNGKTQNYRIHSGLIQPGSSYKAFIDAEIDVDRITGVTFVWSSGIFSLLPLKMGASKVSVQRGKDGSTFSFCDSTTVSSGVPQVLKLCP